jgi:glycosyltransferase involved in cell wall biosynthesis
MDLKVISCLTSGRISGVDVFACHLTAGLRARGVDARILLTHPDRAEADRMPLMAGIPYDTLPAAWRIKRRYRRRALRAYLLANAPCIYIPNYDYDHSPIAANLPDDIATVGIIHSDDPMHYDHARQLGRFWNAAVAVSRQIAHIADRLGVVGDRLHTIPYGVPTMAQEHRPRRSASDPLRVLYVGRLEQNQKRVFEFPAILDELSARGVPVVLSMAGDGPAREELEARGRVHVSAGRMRLLGTLPNEQMASVYRDADVFLLTSAFEGLPVSLLEAMSMGCVPVVTRVQSGVSEVVDDSVSGFLCPIGATSVFADRLQELQRNPERLASLSRAAAQVIEQGEHSVSRMVDRYLDVFERVLQDRRSGVFERPRPYWGELFVKHWQCRLSRNVRRLTGRRDYLPS